MQTASLHLYLWLSGKLRVQLHTKEGGGIWGSISSFSLFYLFRCGGKGEENAKCFAIIYLKVNEVIQAENP